MKPEYSSVIHAAMSHFIQEIIDFESFSDEGPKDLTLNQLFTELADKLSSNIAAQLHDCVLEFCITNEYLREGESWNCIDHLLKNHSNLLTPQDKKYLKVLNATHLSLYKVCSVQPGLSLVLQDIIEKSDRITVLTPDAAIGEFLQGGHTIAARLLAINHKMKPIEYNANSG